MGRQDMRRFGQGWSGNAQLFWGAPPPVDQPIRNWPHLTLVFSAPPGTYDVVLHYTSAPDFGTFRVFLDSQPAGDVNGYGPAVAPQIRSLGRRTLTPGTHQLVVTVFEKASASKGFAVGLDRIELRQAGAQPGPSTNVSRRAPQTMGPVVPRPQATHERTPRGGGPVEPIDPKLLAPAVCLASPETCCPAGKTTTDGCKMVTEQLLDIRIRSYVPPRFTMMGRHYPWGPDSSLANIVSDVTVNGPYQGLAGMPVQRDGGQEHDRRQQEHPGKGRRAPGSVARPWSGGVETAKSFVSAGVAGQVCKVVDDSQSCRDKVAAW